MSVVATTAPPAAEFHLDTAEPGAPAAPAAGSTARPRRRLGRLPLPRRAGTGRHERLFVPLGVVALGWGLAGASLAAAAAAGARLHRAHPGLAVQVGLLAAVTALAGFAGAFVERRRVLRVARAAAQVAAPAAGPAAAPAAAVGAAGQAAGSQAAGSQAAGSQAAVRATVAGQAV